MTINFFGGPRGNDSAIAEVEPQVSREEALARRIDELEAALIAQSDTSAQLRQRHADDMMKVKRFLARAMNTMHEHAEANDLCRVADEAAREAGLPVREYTVNVYMTVSARISVPVTVSGRDGVDDIDSDSIDDHLLEDAISNLSLSDWEIDNIDPDRYSREMTGTITEYDIELPHFAPLP